MIPEITRSFTLALDYLRRLVADVPDERFTEQAGGASNHPAWVIGHLVYSCQAIGGEMGVETWLPAHWDKRFGTGSIPVPARGDYPSKSVLLDSLGDAQARILARLAELDDEGLKRPLPDERHRSLFPTIGHAVLHILTVHTALHVGQITVWRRAVGFGPLHDSFI